jgi:hypothetical protein
LHKSLSRFFFRLWILNNIFPCGRWWVAKAWIERLLEMILIFSSPPLLLLFTMMMLLWRHKKFYLRMFSSPGVRELDRI